MMPDERVFDPPSGPHECAVYKSRLGKIGVRLEDGEHLGLGEGTPLTVEGARRLAAALLECADYVEGNS